MLFDSYKQGFITYFLDKNFNVTKEITYEIPTEGIRFSDYFLLKNNHVLAFYTQDSKTFLVIANQKEVIFNKEIIGSYYVDDQSTFFVKEENQKMSKVTFNQKVGYTIIIY